MYQMQTWSNMYDSLRYPRNEKPLQPETVFWVPIPRRSLWVVPRYSWDTSALLRALGYMSNHVKIHLNQSHTMINQSCTSYNLNMFFLGLNQTKTIKDWILYLIHNNHANPSASSWHVPSTTPKNLCEFGWIKKTSPTITDSICLYLLYPNM